MSNTRLGFQLGGNASPSGKSHSILELSLTFSRDTILCHGTRSASSKGGSCMFPASYRGGESVTSDRPLGINMGKNIRKCKQKTSSMGSSIHSFPRNGDNTQTRKSALQRRPALEATQVAGVHLTSSRGSTKSSSFDRTRRSATAMA